jgi:hypothetical protein
VPHRGEGADLLWDFELVEVTGPDCLADGDRRSGNAVAVPPQVQGRHRMAGGEVPELRGEIRAVA